MRVLPRGDRPWFRGLGLFWTAITLGLIALGGIQTAGDDPAVLHSMDGLVTGALMLAYTAWFLYVMHLRARRHGPMSERPGVLRRFLTMGIGMVLALALISLHAEFAALA